MYLFLIIFVNVFYLYFYLHISLFSPEANLLVLNITIIAFTIIIRFFTISFRPSLGDQIFKARMKGFFKIKQYFAILFFAILTILPGIQFIAKASLMWVLKVKVVSTSSSIEYYWVLLGRSSSIEYWKQMQTTWSPWSNCLWMNF